MNRRDFLAVVGAAPFLRSIPQREADYPPKWVNYSFTYTGVTNEDFMEEYRRHYAAAERRIADELAAKLWS